MAKLCTRLRLLAAAVVIAAFAAGAAPVAAQQPAAVNPTADAVKEQQLLQQSNRIQGLGSIPDVKSYVIEQPMGRVWRQFHEVWLHWIGAIAVLG
ncbi:MAG: formate dehydrogenase subunit gamma, partial [Xanthobacteraceae bacterium]